MSLTIDLPEELLERVAERAAELVAERQSSVSRWLTVDEAADYLRCPKSRIYSLVSARRIPFVKDGSRSLFERPALDEWLRKGGGKRP